MIDIFPTLQDICNLKGIITKDKKPYKADGFSLKPFLENPKTKNWKGPNGVLTVLGAGGNKPIEGLGYSRNKGALWHIEISGDLEAVYVKKQNYSYRTKKWRYILYKDGSEELYNSLSDPNEWVNLESYKKYKKVKTKLKNELLNFLD